MFKIELSGEQLSALLSSKAFTDQLQTTVRQVLSESQILSRHSDHDIMTVRQCAEYLNITPGAIYAMVFRKNIPCSKRGKRLLFSRKALQFWMDEGHKPTAEEIKQSAKEQLLKRKK
jgi:excisionase family DNA binding protein